MLSTSSTLGLLSRQLSFAYRAISCLVLLILTACSTVPDEQYSLDWQQQQQRLEQLQSYKVTGKFGYRDLNNRQSLSFVLVKSASYSELKLLSFLGQTVLTLQMNPSGAMVTDASGRVQNAQSANLLMERLTGLSIPIEQLSDWMKGLPSDADSIAFNDTTNSVDQLTKEISKRVWTLDYLNYQAYRSQDSSANRDSSSAEQLVLPKNMKLSQNNTELKIAINNWIF